MPDAGKLSSVTFNGLKEAEWRIGVTTSSSEAGRVGQTFVQVKMQVDCGAASDEVRAGESTKTIQVEMSVPQFYNFLGEMEKVKASLSLFK